MFFTPISPPNLPSSSLNTPNKLRFLPVFPRDFQCLSVSHNNLCGGPLWAHQQRAGGERGTLCTGRGACKMWAWGAVAAWKMPLLRGRGHESLRRAQNRAMSGEGACEANTGTDIGKGCCVGGASCHGGGRAYIECVHERLPAYHTRERGHKPL